MLTMHEISCIVGHKNPYESSSLMVKIFHLVWFTLCLVLDDEYLYSWNCIYPRLRILSLFCSQ